MEQNAVPSDHTSEQDSVQLTFVYNRELWLWKIHTRDTRRLTDRFSISSPRDFVFWFFFSWALWQSQITDPETDMKLKKKNKKKTSKWNRSCQGNFAKPAAVRDNGSHATFKLWESSAEQFILQTQKEKGRFIKKAPSNPRPWKEQLNNRDLICFLSVH